ncbi:hypothetical protein [Clostridium sp. VAP52]|nr:hypothetical protein [Clostridium sp. VAP52]
MDRDSMIEFIIKFGGIDDIEIREELNNKSDKSLEELFNFTKFMSKILA